MGRRSSDSEEDRRRKHKSSRKRDRGSRSRERRKRSRSRERKRSQSRSSSCEDYRRCRLSRKGHRFSRSSSSRSTSSSSSNGDRRRSRKDKSLYRDSSSQLTKEKTKQKMKKALAKAESKDEILKRDKAVKELRELAPDKDVILQIESSEFVPQSFSSSSGYKGDQIGRKNIDGSHEEAMFGVGGTVPEISSSTVATTELKTAPQSIISQNSDKEGLFASWLHENEETKTSRWITKLKKMRQELLAAT